MKKRLLLMKTGDALDSVRQKVGDFDRMFRETLGDDVRVIEAHKNEALPALDSFDALLISGSPLSVTWRERWAEDASTFTRAAIEANKHVLGVCYGHQLIAHALGGEVIKNPKGYEVGTIDVELTEEGSRDPLLGALPERAFNLTHSDIVSTMPKQARLLASTTATQVQAFAIGERAWGVQFHPEFNEETMRLYVEGRSNLIRATAEKNGVDPEGEIERTRRAVRATPAGPALLRRFLTLMLTALLAVTLGAIAGCSPCQSESSGATELRFEDPGARLPDFAAHPWPSNARKRAGGQIDLSALPNPTNSSTLEDYATIISDETYAFSTSAAMYLSFTGPIDPASLPADPIAATRDDSSLQIVDIDPNSPVRGERRPLSTRFQEKATLYLPPNNLTVIPPYGIPLASDRTYALIGRTGLRAKDGSAIKAGANLSRALRGSCAEDAPAKIAQAFAPLRQFLSDMYEDADEAAGDIVLATVFTTQGTVREIRQLADVARALPVVELRELELYGEVREESILLQGIVHLPSFQQGSVPYANLGDGGGLYRNADGVPLVDHFERTRVSFSIPRRDRGHMPGPKGWPVVLHSHGTGGDYRCAFDPTIADKLGEKGIAVVGYDQTLHGPRDPTHSDPDLTFFNLFNPLAARDNVRQGTADLVSMTNLLASGVVLPAGITGAEDETFDPDRIAFMGHSQGSLVAAPWLVTEPRIKAVVFSGLGAILTITLLERKDIIDFKGLLESLLRLPPEEPLEELHPVLNLIQTFIEPADPISYASSYLSDPPGGALCDILQVEGFLDFASPARGQEAFATAARIPLVAPQYRVPPAAVLVGPAPEDAPARGNVESRGGRVTYGLIQYPEETHYPIFNNADANARYVEFLRSALFDGRAQIIPSE